MTKHLKQSDAHLEADLTVMQSSQLLTEAESSARTSAIQEATENFSNRSVFPFQPGINFNNREA